MNFYLVLVNQWPYPPIDPRPAVTHFPASVIGGLAAEHELKIDFGNHSITR